MGADTKALCSRIKSVDSTLHLTKAMGLAASAKIRGANGRMMKARQYAQSVEKIIDALAASPECRKSPFMRDGGERIRLIVIAGDRGLAGGYNANVFRLLKEYPEADAIPIGRRACDRFRRPVLPAESFSAADARKMAEALCRDFAEEKFDRLGIVCTRYISMMAQEPCVRWVFPLRPAGKNAAGVVFEPDETAVLHAAVLEYLCATIVASVRESFACEVAARKTAMDSASRNAQEMIDGLKLSYNRARQAAITQEITEIVAGSGQ